MQQVFLLKFLPDMNCCELRESYFQNLCAFHIPTAVLEAASTIGPDMVYSFFKDMSCNYLNL